MIAPLPQSMGYGIVVGLGLAFALTMIGITASLRRYQREVITSEEFSTAGRTVKSGLIAAAVVSSWTWAATLLQSTSQAYKNGVSGPFWYASGATVQVILFATLAIELKKKAPGAHTYLEVIKKRYGAVTHCVYLMFAVFTNILVTAMLLTGGSAVVSDLTGMNTVAACFLLPLGVIVYTLFGGIKATFLTDYIHTVILLVIIFIFAFTVFGSSPLLGSPGAVWDKLTELAKASPVEGNAEGSYLTMRSYYGGIFFVINIAGNFGTVFLDNGYWNKAIAASPVAAFPGYVLGGLAWFPVPFLTATTMGLAGLALQGNPAWPTYPANISAAEVSAGLVLPDTAVAILGHGGACCALLIVFMAVTSASSAELIAVSSITTYDIYKSYIDPHASGKKLIFMSHASVVIFGFAMAGFSTGLYYAGVSMGFLYLMMGVIISAAVLPAALSILWSGQNWWAATFSPLIGFGCALITWLVTTKGMYGPITVDTAGADMPMLAGNVVALCSPLIWIPLFTLIFGMDKYDFNLLKSIRKVRDDEKVEVSDPGEANSSMALDVTEDGLEEYTPEEAEKLEKYSKISKILCAVMAFCLLVLWPMPMYGTGYVFSRKFFTGWIVVGIIWLFFSLFVVAFLPLWEGREAIFHTVRGIYWDVTFQSYKLKAWQQTHKSELHHAFHEPPIMGTEPETKDAATTLAKEKEEE